MKRSAIINVICILLWPNAVAAGDFGIDFGLNNGSNIIDSHKWLTDKYSVTTSWQRFPGDNQMPVGPPDFTPVPPIPLPSIPIHLPRNCDYVYLPCYPQQTISVWAPQEDAISSHDVFNPLFEPPSCENARGSSLAADCWRARHDTVQITTEFSLGDESFGFETLPVSSDGSADYGSITSGDIPACTGFVRPGNRSVIDTVFHCASKMAKGEIFGLDSLSEMSEVDCSNSSIRVALRSLEPMPTTTLVGRCKLIKRLPADRAEITLDEPLGELVPSGLLGEIDVSCGRNPSPSNDKLFSVQYAYGRYRVEVHTGQMRPPEGCQIALGWIRSQMAFSDDAVMCSTLDTVVGSSGSPVFSVTSDGLTLIGFASSAASSEFKHELEALLGQKQIPEDCGHEGACNLLTRFAASPESEAANQSNKRDWFGSFALATATGSEVCAGLQ
ncbi:hypothetical protein PARHAE_02047 [Paracoccus haematequi]|uniref:Trypsin n=1 Tax=Paracoccus haematequi TaxID=2491866 RepID=A0A447IMU4_9RHOB|nr:hypothetical protein [Paracoccus haematequi]VDS08862.1 hypothetical protein PARHAE_02047 [Paracoccus haematequi]